MKYFFSVFLFSIVLNVHAADDLGDFATKIKNLNLGREIIEVSSVEAIESLNSRLENTDAEKQCMFQKINIGYYDNFVVMNAQNFLESKGESARSYVELLDKQFDILDNFVHPENYKVTGYQMRKEDYLALQEKLKGSSLSEIDKIRATLNFRTLNVALSSNELTKGFSSVKDLNKESQGAELLKLININVDLSNPFLIWDSKRDLEVSTFFDKIASDCHTKMVMKSK